MKCISQSKILYENILISLLSNSYIPYKEDGDTRLYWTTDTNQKGIRTREALNEIKKVDQDG